MIANTRAWWNWLALVVLCTTCLSPLRARAGGLELLPGGTRSVARGGAVLAKPEDPMVLLHNPAGLVSLPGGQFMLNFDTTIHDMCFDPYGYYGWGVLQAGSSDFGDQLALAPVDAEPTYATTPLPEVCNSTPVVPLPQLAWALRLSERVAIGLGMVFPTIVPGLRYGGEDGTIEVDARAMPTPTRYQLIEQKADFALAPSFGAAYRVMPELALGLNLQVAMLSVSSRGVQNLTSGTQPSTDWLAELKASDYFVPSLTFAAQVTPIEALDLVATFRWIDGFDGSGSARYESNTFRQNAESGGYAFENEPFELSSVRVEAPWLLAFGARYSSTLADESGEPDKSDQGKGDAMDTELWDVEVDASYSLNERANTTIAEAGEDIAIVTRVVGAPGGNNTAAQSELAKVVVHHHFENSVALRMGGSYAVMPREVALHAGGFFETQGIDPSYASVGSFAFERFGLGLGMTVRLGSVDLLAAYGHIFQRTMEIVPPDDPALFDQRVGGSFAPGGERVESRLLEDPEVPEEGDAVAKLKQQSIVPPRDVPERIVNAGKYTAAFDVISVGLQYHF